MYNEMVKVYFPITNSNYETCLYGSFIDSFLIHYFNHLHFGTAILHIYHDQLANSLANDTSTPSNS